MDESVKAVSHRKLNPLSEVDPKPVDGSDAAKHILVVGDRVEVTDPDPSGAPGLGKQGTVTHMSIHTSQRTGGRCTSVCIKWDLSEQEEAERQAERQAKAVPLGPMDNDEELARTNYLCRLTGWTHWLKVINGPERQRAKERAFSCSEPVTFREAELEEGRSYRWENQIWHFQNGIQTGKDVICYGAQHSGKHYPDSDKITMGKVAEVSGNEVSICWTRHVGCCQQDINVEWFPHGPYSKLESYDFSDVNMAWTGLKDFSSDGTTAKDVMLSAMKTIRCVYNDFPLTVCSNPEAGWNKLVAIPSPHAVVLTIESFESGVLHLRELSGNTFSIPANVGDTVSSVVANVWEVKELSWQTIQLVTSDGNMLDDDAIVCHEGSSGSTGGYVK